MEGFLRLLRDRRAEMETGVMTHPPSTWDEFQKRLGRWIELTNLIQLIEGKAQTGEDQENG